MHPYYKHTNTFHFEHDICWVTGMKDIYHAGIIDKAHIVDKQLAGKAQYDQHNQIKLNTILHIDECLVDRTKYFEQRLNDANEYHMATTHKASVRKTFRELALRQGWV